MPALPRIILASASPRRADLLREMGVAFRVVPSHATEVAGSGLPPSAVALTNSVRKALLVAATHPKSLVLGADTVVALGSRLFGKPENLRAAAAMLRALSGKTHEVITGVCLVCIAEGRFDTFAETSRVTFRQLGASRIAKYLKDVPVLDKAGAYAIQEKGDELTLRVQGSVSNVVGLPVERLGKLLMS